MERMRKIICEICGSQAEVPMRRRLDYCDNEYCKLEMKKRQALEASKRFYSKQNETQIITTQTNTATTPIVTPKKFKQFVEPEQRIVSTNAAEIMDIADIRELTRQLGAIRYSLIQLIEKERSKMERDTKDSATLQHAFEFENLTKEEVWEKYNEIKETRTQRRATKYRYLIIKMLLDSIKIKNPDKFLVEAINGCKTERNLGDYLKELEKDKELFN